MSYTSSSVPSSALRRVTSTPNVRLADHLPAHELEHHVFVPRIRRAQQDAGHVLARNTGRELNLAALETAGTDVQRQATLALDVLDLASIGAERIDERAAWALLHASIAGDERVAFREFFGHSRRGRVGSDERANAGKEACRSAGVAEIDLLADGRDRERASATGHNQSLAAVFPRKFGAL
jgi:hypothetical protein